MSENTKIEWCDHTFNPWEGCQKVGPGCDHCYAETRNSRFNGGQAINWGPGAPRRRTTPANWQKPLKWQANAAAFFAEHGRRQRVFCASLADVFDNEVDPFWRLDLLDLIRQTPDLDWLLLTKRVGNVGAMLDGAMRWANVYQRGEQLFCWLRRWHYGSAPANVWLGSTITSQAEADRDIPKLLAVPARVRFLSMEPLLGPVDLRFHIFSEPTGNWRTHQGKRQMELRRPDDGGLHWVIVGGESGPGARPMHPDWARSLRDQCQAAGVPFMFKQWGNWRAAVWFDGPDADEDEGDDFVDLDRTDHIFLANDGRTWDTEGGRFMYPPLPLGHWCLMVNEGKKAAGRLLDGVEHSGFPGGAQ